MKLSQPALAANVLALKATPQARARIKLQQWADLIAKMPEGEQFALRCAVEEFTEWTELHGRDAEIVLAMYQLQKLAGEETPQ